MDVIDAKLQNLRLELRHAGAAPLLFSPSSYARTYESARQQQLAVALRPSWFSAAEDVPAELRSLRLPAAAAEAAVQLVFEQQVAPALDRAAGVPTVRLVGRSSKVSYATRKPDVVGYVTDVARAGVVGECVPLLSESTAHICIVGDLKPLVATGAQSAEVFTAEQKGHVLSFAEDLARAQPWRGDLVRVVAFLSDCRHIVFFEVTFRTTSQPGAAPLVALESGRESAPLPITGEGGAFLAGLTRAPLAALGYNLPTRATLAEQQGEAEVVDYLGMGATAMGFAAVLRGAPVVLKRYLPAADAAARALEASALTASRSRPGICRMVGREPDAAGLVLAPVGAVHFSLSPLATLLAPEQSGLWEAGDGSESGGGATACGAGDARVPRAADYCDLVDALTGLHAAGWVHRDPRPSNFFRTAGGRFVLADLGSAAAVGQDCTADRRPWAFHYGPLRALAAMEAREQIPPAAPSDDFEQVARLAYVTLTRYEPPVAPEAAGIRSFWMYMEARGLEPLTSLLRAAAAAAANEAGRDAFKREIRRALA